MPNLDKETIKNLTRLCRIDCTEEEQDALLHDLKKILDYIEQLQEIDTEQVPPCHQVLDNMANVVRDDRPENTLEREIFLANTISVGGMVRVPPIMKQS